MAFDIFPDPPHDPSGQPSDLYTVEIKINPGQTLTAATVVVVDGADNAIVGTDLTILDVSYGVVSGNVWGVSFRLQGGSPQTYLLRTRYTTNRGTPPAGSDITMRVKCANT